jgi:hypothetical protein
MTRCLRWVGDRYLEIDPNDRPVYRSATRIYTGDATGNGPNIKLTWRSKDAFDLAISEGDHVVGRRRATRALITLDGDAARFLSEWLAAAARGDKTPGE